jgi:hypothetical protein
MTRVIQIEADVPESRQVTVTLPPDVPTGRVRLTVSVEFGDEGRVPLPRLQAILAHPEPEVVYSGQLRVCDSEKQA